MIKSASMKLSIIFIMFSFFSSFAQADISLSQDNPRVVSVTGADAVAIDGAMRVALKTDSQSESVETNLLSCSRLGMGQIICYAGFMKQIPASMSVFLAKLLTSSEELIVQGSGGKIKVGLGDVIKLLKAKCSKSSGQVRCEFLYGAGGNAAEKSL